MGSIAMWFPKTGTMHCATYEGNVLAPEWAVGNNKYVYLWDGSGYCCVRMNHKRVHHLCEDHDEVLVRTTPAEEGKGLFLGV